MQVAFIHIDRQMILTIHNHVITRIPRFTITHDKHFTWSLKIENVQKEDKGFYMCQVNTDPMVSKVGYLDVVGMYFLYCVSIFHKKVKPVGVHSRPSSDISLTLNAKPILS